MLKRFLALFGLGTPADAAVQAARPRLEPSQPPPDSTDAAPVRPQEADADAPSPRRTDADPDPDALPPAALPVRPYGQARADLLYNLLFCDDWALARSNAAADAVSLPGALWSEPPDVAAIEAVALDRDGASRARALAFERLRALGRPVPPGELLGVVIEVPLDAGLDTLAVYADRRIHYIDHAGRPSVFEAPPPASVAQLEALLRASERATERIGPWPERRQPPPPVDSARMTFIASDGARLGEGPFGELMREPLAAPIVQAAGALLEQLVRAADDASQADRSPA